jgi:hypothetical protein
MRKLLVLLLVAACAPACTPATRPGRHVPARTARPRDQAGRGKESDRVREALRRAREAMREAVEEGAAGGGRPHDPAARRALQ